MPVAGNEGRDGLDDLFELFFQAGDGFGEMGGHGFGQARHLAAQFGVEHPLELLTPGDPGGYLSLHWFWRSGGSWLDGLTEGGEHPGVDPVGLGEAAGSCLLYTSPSPRD